MGADEGLPAEVRASHPADLGWDGRGAPRGAFPQCFPPALNGPVPLRRTGVLVLAPPGVHPAGRRQENQL
jgi:hypothetical protein